MKSKIIIGVLCAIIIIFAVSYSFSGKNDGNVEVTKVKIADLPVVHGLPLYLAIEKGYFKDVGIDVERVKFEAPNQIIDAVMSGNVDFSSPSAALGIAGVAYYKNPSAMKIYAVSGGTIGNSGVNIVASVQSNVNSIGDLKGKKLGIIAGSIQWRTLAKEVLSKKGIDIEKDLTLVEIAPSLQVQALSSGQIDALFAIEPTGSVAISKSVAKTLMSDPTVKTISDPSWLGAGIVNTKFARENPNTTKKVLSVFARAMNEIEENPDKYREYLKNNTSLTDDLIKRIAIVDFKMVDNLNDVDIDSIKKFFAVFKKYSVINGDINVDEMLYK